MICTTLQNKSLGEIDDLMDQLEMAEIRLDRCDLSSLDVKHIFHNKIPLVATCRVDGCWESDDPAEASKETLIEAVRAGADFVDVEDEAPKEVLYAVRDEARKCRSSLIISHHDFSKTPSYPELKAIVKECFSEGADIVKIATMAKSERDVKRIARLYEDFEPSKLIAFCMGWSARGSRIDCLEYGAPFTYAALDGYDVAAPGQMPTSNMMQIVYGDRKPFGHKGKEVRMPTSKSFAQRAIIAAALADGESCLRDYTPCDDSEAALNVARALGAEINLVSAPSVVYGRGSKRGKSRADELWDIRIRGIGARPGSVDVRELNVGESGLLTRMMIPLCSAISSSDVTLRGEKTLLNRPMKGASEIMSRFGVRLSGETVPLEISGTLSGGKAKVSGKNGSQLISGLLMAEPLVTGNSIIRVAEPKSIPYLFMTDDVIKEFGVNVEEEMVFDGKGDMGDLSKCTEINFRVNGGQSYHAADIDLEGDWSAAANFLVAGAIFGKAILTGLNTSSVQADAAIIDILHKAGVKFEQYYSESGPLIVRRYPLKAFEVDATNCPDLFPIVSVLAAFCEGTSRIEGVDRLAHKESDRGAAIVNMLTKMGVPVRIEGNALVIEGHSLARRRLAGTLLRGGKYTSCHDHRMAMALKVASLGAKSPIVIDDKDCVAKSFPAFFDIFKKFV